MKYKKVTQGLPDIGEKCMVYNGETEFKNYFDGIDEGWRYQYKYPITHWRYAAKTPDFVEVQQVREQLTKQQIL